MGMSAGRSAARFSLMARLQQTRSKRPGQSTEAVSKCVGSLRGSWQTPGLQGPLTVMHIQQNTMPGAPEPGKMLS